MNVKVADDHGRCLPSALASGITWAVDNGANIINISIEIGQPSAQLEKAINYAWDKGVLIIAAAGNDGKSSPVYPAYYTNCIAVSAVKDDGTLVPLSNFGSWVDIAAPGMNIYSTLPNNEYGYKSGTSSAASYISGVAAKLWSVAVETNSDGRLNDDVRDALEHGADTSSTLACGIVNPTASLVLVESQAK